jgi:hypothetical protein
MRPLPLELRLANRHAYYQEHVAIYTIDPVELIAGTLPRRQHRLVEAWAELLTDWQRLQEGHKPQPIEPLK